MTHDTHSCGSGDVPVVETDGNPVPGQGRCFWLERRDGALLRYGVWMPSNGIHNAAAINRGTIYLVPGRTEFIEKYFEVIGELLDRRFAVVVMDPRGQGLSSRDLADRWKGHVADFSQFVEDLDAVVTATQAQVPKPFHLLGHSMGGHISLRYLGEHGDKIERVILTSPMVDIGFDAVTSLVVRALAYSSIYFGRANNYVLGAGNPDPHAETFEKNIVTSDAFRFERTLQTLKAGPELALGPPTFGWLAAAFRSTSRLMAPGFAKLIDNPILMLSAGREKLVSNQAQRVLAERLPNCQFIEIPEAMHEILMEKDMVRTKFWSAFDSFMEGEEYDANEV